MHTTRWGLLSQPDKQKSPSGGQPVANPGSRSAVLVWLNAKTVINYVPQLLFAAEISFCGLDRDVPEQELNLIVAEHRVCARDNCKHGREIAAECLSCVRWSATLTQSASLKDCP